MRVDIKPGVYVVAVSGGVDSVTLLDVLAKKPKARLIVAHFDHGMRPDSEKDRQYVQALAAKYGLPFVYDEGHLGPEASEATARKARYKFLERAKNAAGADAIITAHHQDDVLETAIINLLRGTGRRGLTSLKSDKIIRPLLDVPKKDIVVYAKKHRLKWREDPTNVKLDYLRNYVRHKLLAKFDKAAREQLLGIITNLRITNLNLDKLLRDILKKQSQTSELDRQMFLSLSHSTSKELMAAWLRQNKIANYEARTLERLVRAAKTYKPGKKTNINKQQFMVVGKEKLALLR